MPSILKIEEDGVPAVVHVVASLLASGTRDLKVLLMSWSVRFKKRKKKDLREQSSAP